MNLISSEKKDTQKSEETNGAIQALRSKWHGLEVTWTEIRSESPERLEHIYQFIMNNETKDLYLDCTKGKIWVKCVAYTILQPIILTIKTIYHGLIVTAFYEMYTELQKMNHEEKESQTVIPWKDKTVRCLKTGGLSLVDIVRTPIYGTALLLIAVAGVIIGPFASKEFLYEIRAAAGKTELILCREKSTEHAGANNNWILFRCFHTLNNLDTINKRDSTKTDTDYGNAKNSTEKGLVNLASSVIRFRRTEHCPFNTYKGIPCRLFPKNESYVSSNVKK